MREWLLLRAADEDGQGWLWKDAFVSLLASDGPWGHISPRRAHQLIAQYDGTYWKDCGDSVQLYGVARVAAALGVEKLGGKSVLIRTARLAGKLKTARAEMYATWHAARDASPISRARLAEITHASPRAQQQYDVLSNTHVSENIALSGHLWSDTGARRKIAQARGRASFMYVDWAGRFGEKQARHVAYLLPNTYTNPNLKVAPKGRQQKHNSKLASLVNKVGGTTPNKRVILYCHDKRNSKGKVIGAAAQAAKVFDRTGGAQDVYWKARRVLVPASDRRARLKGVGVYHALSLQGVS
jgi:hypothetical protein